MVLATCPEPLRYVCGEGRARQRNPNTLDFVAAKLQGQIRPDVVSFPKLQALNLPFAARHKLLAKLTAKYGDSR